MKSLKHKASEYHYVQTEELQGEDERENIGATVTMYENNAGESLFTVELIDSNMDSPVIGKAEVESHRMALKIASDWILGMETY